MNFESTGLLGWGGGGVGGVGGWGVHVRMIQDFSLFRFFPKRELCFFWFVDCCVGLGFECSGFDFEGFGGAGFRVGVSELRRSLGFEVRVCGFLGCRV